MKLAVSAMLLVIAMAGCQPAPTESGSGQGNPSSESPAQRLRDQLSAGSYQFDAAVDTISKSWELAQQLSVAVKDATVKAALQEVAEILNVVGQRLTEFTDEPPPLVEVETGFAQFDEQRLKAIEAGNDSIHEIEEAIGILRAITEDQVSGFTDSLAELINGIVEVGDNIAGAVEAFGGVVEPETSE